MPWSERYDARLAPANPGALLPNAEWAWPSPGRGAPTKGKAVICREEAPGMPGWDECDARDGGQLALSNTRVVVHRLVLIPKMLARLPAGALKNVAALPGARSTVSTAARSLPVSSFSLPTR